MATRAGAPSLDAARFSRAKSTHLAFKSAFGGCGRGWAPRRPDTGQRLSALSGFETVNQTGQRRLASLLTHIGRNLTLLLGMSRKIP